MISTRVSGSIPEPETNCDRKLGRPESVRNRVKMIADTAMKKIPEVEISASRRDSNRTERVRLRRASAITNTTKAPKAPASVGVTMPP